MIVIIDNIAVLLSSMVTSKFIWDITPLFYVKLGSSDLVN